MLFTVRLEVVRAVEYKLWAYRLRHSFTADPMSLVFVIFGIIILGYVLINNLHQEQPQKPQYQGPVPLGYDEQYFRETGITKPLENNPNEK